ncbi:HEAT repeat domain-containing protein [bacterium]|nr:HEAT repeat domain-containing protein [bacterium]
MENELVKKLCAKQGFETAAAEIINKPDVEAFSALVEKSDFLFDFVKQNVIKRLQTCINKDNYKNLLNFLKIYSYDYEDLIVSNLQKYGDVEDSMSELLQNGSDQEKTYCVKFFENNNKYAEIFRRLSSSDFEPLAYNCAAALGKIQDKESLEIAIAKLKTNDDFEILEAIKFLSAYGNKSALPNMFEAMKKSSMAENIACEIVYTENIFDLLKNYPNDTLLLLNHIVNGLGEVVPLSVVFDIQLYELIEHTTSPLLLLHIKQKIEQLTENDEYLFDEDKSVKEEILAVKDFLNSKPIGFWDGLSEELELKEDDFIFFNLQLISDLQLDYSDEIKALIDQTKNQTVILKSVEVLKSIGQLNKISKEYVTSKITDQNILSIIEHCFS